MCLVRRHTHFPSRTQTYSTQTHIVQRDTDTALAFPFILKCSWGIAWRRMCRKLFKMNYNTHHLFFRAPAHTHSHSHMQAHIYMVYQYRKGLRFSLFLLFLSTFSFGSNQMVMCEFIFSGAFLCQCAYINFSLSSYGLSARAVWQPVVRFYVH